MVESKPLHRVFLLHCPQRQGSSSMRVLLLQRALGTIPLKRAGANGLPLWGGAQLAVILISADTAQPSAPLARPRNRYLELLRLPRCRLLVFALEAAGRWSPEAARFTVNVVGPVLELGKDVRHLACLPSSRLPAGALGPCAFCLRRVVLDWGFSALDHGTLDEKNITQHASKTPANPRGWPLCGRSVWTVRPRLPTKLTTARKPGTPPLSKVRRCASRVRGASVARVGKGSWRTV